MFKEIDPLKEHKDSRRTDALFIARELYPYGTTEDIIREAKKLTAYILDSKNADIICINRKKKNV